MNQEKTGKFIAERRKNKKTKSLFKNRVFY